MARSAGRKPRARTTTTRTSSPRSDGKPRASEPMWRPRALGAVIAERTLTFRQRGRPGRIVTVRFGRPVRSPRPRPGDPWWCPIETKGLGPRVLRSIAGEDSLQAAVLAFEFVVRVLPAQARRAGGHLEWLGARLDAPAEPRG